MGANAPQYPQTLVDVAKMAFNHPVLSLRLIGVVESKSALKGRIKRMLDGPIPKNARLGILGLIALLISAAVLLPMAKAEERRFFVTGTVRDAVTGEPLEGVRVEDARYGNSEQGALTDANGQYRYETWYEEHNVVARVKGYLPQEKIVKTKLIGYEKERILDFELSPEKNDKRTQFNAALPNGVTVELVGICDYPDGGVRCWRPDGSKSQKQIYATKWNKKNPQPDEFGIMFKLNGPEDLSFSWNKINGSDSYEGSCKVMDDQGNQLKDFEAAIAEMTERNTTTSVRIGIASGPWSTVVTHSGKGITTTGDKDILFSQAFETNSFVGITVSSQWRKDRAERIVAIDTNGQIRTTENIGSVASGKIDQMTAKFHGLKLKDIYEFQFQTRPYKWVTFSNVSLTPGAKTDVQVDIEEAGKVGDKDEMVPENSAADGTSDKEPEKIVEQAVMTISTCAETDPQVKKSLESLQGLDGQVVVKEIVKFLDSGKSTVRRSAIYILWKGDFKSIEPAERYLMNLCLHEDEYTRGMAALTLGARKVYPAFDTLCNMASNDPSAYARRCAAYSLGLMGNPEAKDVLEKALKDSDLDVRNNAEAALTMLSQVEKPKSTQPEAEIKDRGREKNKTEVQ